MYKHFNKFLTLLSVFFILNTVAVYAQEAQLSDSSRALQFQISEDFLSSFTGSVISYKWHLSADEARRLGVSLNASYLARELTSTPGNNNTANSSNINISVVFSWMYYINPDAVIKFYYGYGPALSFGYGESQIESPNGTKREVTNTRYSIAALGYAGVEWFFLPSMSLHAEYRASISVSSINEEGERSESEGTNFRLGGNGVLFGLSVYF